MNLNEKYRPTCFEEVLNQEAVIKSIKDLLAKDGKLPPLILFSGNPGLGKTTLARICAKQVGCTEANKGLTEINGAEKTGKEDMEEILELISFIPFGHNKNRVILIDEAQMLSKSAWNSLLKPTEKPPEGTSWIFCSTDPTKIPKAFLSRSTPYELKKVEPTKIRALLTKVAEKEGFTTDKSIINMIAIKCEGSPRKALKYLEMLHNVGDGHEAQELIKSIDASEAPPVLALCRILARKGTWDEAIDTLKDLDEDAEVLRLGVLHYFSAVIVKIRNVDEIKRYLYIMDAFRTPFNPAEKLAPILLALARVLIDD